MERNSQITTAYIGLGSNLGDSQALINRALKELADVDATTITGVSRVLKTESLGDKTQPDYLNAVAQVSTSQSAEVLFGRIRAIEDLLGRQRTARWAPRTIDLDLLLYGDKKIRTPELTVPHPQMHLRSFVLEGMCELAGGFIHPVLKQTMRTLAERLGGNDYVINPEAPQLISIAGVIGVGKTTLAMGLSKALGCERIREAYDTNPYMEEAYAGNTDVALDWQLYFLNSRFEQLNKANLRPGRVVVSDYAFDKEKIYSRRVLTPDQLALYNKRFKLVESNISQPVLVIYLRDSAQVCLERIHSRNRPYEQNIELRTLQDFYNDYEKLFNRWDTCPVIRLSTKEFDCFSDEAVKDLAKVVESYIWRSQEQ